MTMDVGVGPAPAGPANPWEPANDVERRLLAAANAADVREVLRILATAPLYLPGFRDSSSGGDRQRLLTRERDGVPYLLVFTSPEALHRTVTADGWRATSIAELARGTPAGWGLAVDPVTPIGVLVAPDDVPALVPTPASTAEFVPANEVEGLLRDALVALDGEVLLDLLVTSQVIVPTQALEVDGAVTIPVFTSPERLDDFLDGRKLGVPTVTVDLVAVLRQWPGEDHRLAVNPGTPIAFSVGGERVAGLLTYAVNLARRRLGDLPPPPADASPPPGGEGTPRRDVPPPEPELPTNGSIADLLRGPG